MLIVGSARSRRAFAADCHICTGSCGGSLVEEHIDEVRHGQDADRRAFARAGVCLCTRHADRLGSREAGAQRGVANLSAGALARCGFVQASENLLVYSPDGMAKVIEGLASASLAAAPFSSRATPCKARRRCEALGDRRHWLFGGIRRLRRGGDDRRLHVSHSEAADDGQGGILARRQGAGLRSRGLGAGRGAP